MFSSSLHLDAQVLVIHTWEVHEDMHVVNGIPMNVTCMQMKGAEIINQVTIACFRGAIHHGYLYQAKVLCILQDVLCAPQPVLCCDGDRRSQQRQWKEDNTADPRRI